MENQDAISEADNSVGKNCLLGSEFNILRDSYYNGILVYLKSNKARAIAQPLFQMLGEFSVICCMGAMMDPDNP